MRRTIAAAGSLVFFCLAPGLVAGLGPYWLAGWQFREPLPYWAPFRFLGAALLAAGVGFLLHAFIRFVLEGLGTPAPVAPTAHLVVGGIYRFVRNPMYIAVVITIVGQALLFGQLGLLAYAAVIALVQAAFVHFYEEPELRERFGESYDTYRHAVPAWWPRLTPWRGPESV
ncbi:methyltransferase family protein [Phytohabitans rumicis]|uniref:Isoprenylcysteine carboxyl methyltransferase n=1 Tax=Phytohabitans rumicis TaxID=1076125 RepID=A0A6V8LAS3_9ACTN|nr:isoprenylcysteine carboxylmethyltransferase family protein [Phytohabitans rumicis]GFJ91639.1 hypothetical protein Prum_052810 [Phytohabitans rumicis]